MKKMFVSAVLILVVMFGAACGRSKKFVSDNRGCTTVGLTFAAQVVDDETGTTINGAYWLTETLRGEILLELEDGFDPDRHERYMLLRDGNVVHERLKEAAKLSASSDPDDYGSTSEDFRIVVAKEGYATIVREMTAIGDICHIRDVEGDTEFRMVKGPPGPDDIFRNSR
jgi:hypothetical protein